jgi:phage antirepressor YoqD-like protein
MANLTRYYVDDLELVIDYDTNEVFASMSAVARMIDKGDVYVRRYVNGTSKNGTKMELKEAQIPTNAGLRSATLLNEKQILEVICKYKPTLLMEFAQVGLRVYLHTLAGYKVTTTAVETPNEVQPRLPQTYTEALQALLDEAKAREVLDQKLLEQAPKVKFAESVQTAHNLISIEQLAKLLSIPGYEGRNKFFKLLKEEGYLISTNNLPYQKYIDNGWFVVKEVVSPTGFACTVTRVTGKGQLRLAEALSR